MKHVKIYTLDYCPYCKKAKQMLCSLNIAFEEIDVTQEEEKYTKELSNLYSLKSVTYPQIFIGGTRIGGSDALEEYIKSGRLSQILKEDL